MRRPYVLQKRMDIYKHTAVSFAVSTLLLITLKKVQISVSCFLTGILMDLDHVFDYYMNHELRERLGCLCQPRRIPKFLSSGYNKHKSNYRVYKLLHSLELLVPVLLLYIFRVWNEIATGMFIGFAIHLIMDILPLGCIGSVFMVYKVNRGFPEGTDILKQRLSKAGRDLGKCQLCGTSGKTILHKRRSWYAGFTKRGLSKIMILCPECHDRIHDEEDGHICEFCALQ